MRKGWLEMKTKRAFTSIKPLVSWGLAVIAAITIAGGLLSCASASQDSTSAKELERVDLTKIPSRRSCPAIKSAIEALVKGLGDAEALGPIASKAKDKTVLAPAVKPLIKALQDERQATEGHQHIRGQGGVEGSILN